MYAYKDKERKVKVLARNALLKDKGNRFYCPNHLCEASMYIVTKGGVSVSHFASRDHTKGCIHGSKSNSFSPSKYDEQSFDFINALRSLTQNGRSQSNKLTPNSHGTGLELPKPLRSIRQIYDMCKSHDCTDTYNEITVGLMLLDDRSEEMYSSGVTGWRLIESKRVRGKFYDSNKKEIYVQAPILTKKYTFTLKFNDVELYKDIQKKIYANREYIFIVAGEWEPSSRSSIYATHITTRKQIAFE